jgi:hypothetical protein
LASQHGYSLEVFREDFLKRYGLCNGNKGHCEITTGNIKYKYLEDDRSIHPMPTEWTKMKLLRIGKYKARGETATATLQSIVITPLPISTTNLELHNVN